MLQAHKTYYITTKGCLFSFGRKLEASLHRKIIYPMKKKKKKGNCRHSEKKSYSLQTRVRNNGDLIKHKKIHCIILFKDKQSFGCRFSGNYNEALNIQHLLSCCVIFFLLLYISIDAQIHTFWT